MIAREGLSVVDVARGVAQFGMDQEGVAKTVTVSELNAIAFTDSISGNAQRGYHQKRSGDVLFVLASGWIPAGYPTGTTHGSPYRYDTHVPLLWYGAGINKGASSRPMVIADIAATLTELLQIQSPSNCTGAPILELMK